MIALSFVENKIKIKTKEKNNENRIQNRLRNNQIDKLRPSHIRPPSDDKLFA